MAIGGNSHYLSRTLIASAVAAASLSSSSAFAATASATFDRWMYPFGASPGTEVAGSSFSSIASAGFDDRDSQFLVGFGTSGIAPAGRGASAYQVGSVTVSVKVITGNAFVYDPSKDALATYQPNGSDSDAGRPIELNGVGYRNGFTASSFTETTPFSTAAGPAEGVRSAFAADYDGTTAIDVSNNVSGLNNDYAGSFDSNPWAIGSADGASAGSSVPAGQVFTFSLDLSDPDVLAYVQRGLNDGDLRFAISSLHPAAFGGAPTYPRFFTRENSPDNAAALSVTFVPEPASFAAGLIGIGELMLRRRRVA